MSCKSYRKRKMVEAPKNCRLTHKRERHCREGMPARVRSWRSPSSLLASSTASILCEESQDGTNRPAVVSCPRESHFQHQRSSRFTKIDYHGLTQGLSLQDHINAAHDQPYRASHQR